MSLPRSVAAAAALCASLLAASARAQDADGTIVVSDLDARRWYGWQVLAVDVPLTVVMDVGALKENAALLWSGLGAYTVGSPVVHVVNRNTNAAVLSGFTHLLLPGAGWAFGRTAVARLAPSTSPGTRTAIAMTAGAVAATTIDAIYTSFGDYGDVTVVQTGKVLVTPWVGEKSGGVMLVGMGW